MTAPATPTGLLITAGFGCCQAQWKQPVSGGAVGQVTGYQIVVASLGPVGDGSQYANGLVPDGNNPPGQTPSSAAWQWIGAAPATGWQSAHSYSARATILVAGNVWVTLAALTSGASQPAGLSASSPAPGTTVADNGGEWLIVPPWTPDWTVSATSTPPGLTLSNGAVYLCAQSGTTFSTQTINLVPWTAGFKPPVVLTIGRLDNFQTYSVTVAASNGDGSSTPSAPVTVSPVDFQDGLTNTLSAVTGQISHDFITKLGANPPTMWIGEQYLANRDDGQRIVFVPKAGPIGGRGSNHLGDGLSATTPLQEWGSQQLVEAHVWGLQLPTGDPLQNAIASLSQARRLAMFMIDSIHELTVGSMTPQGDFRPARDKTTRGADLGVRFSLEIPVVQYPPSTGEIDGIDFTVSLDL